MRRAVKSVLGQDKYDFFFDKFLEYFFTDADAQFFASLGLNCIRVPFNYRHFEDNMDPTAPYNERGFQWLDRIINICGARGIYTILDLHSAPGGQNQDWHCDSGIHLALFWEHREFQDRTIRLWEALAARYKGNTWVAGYNPLNEPADPDHIRLQDWYTRVEKAIRAIDPDHILYLDGNTYSMDFTHFGDPMPNCVYAIHDYSNFGFPKGERHQGGNYAGTDEQVAVLKSQYARKTEYHKRVKAPIWNGEFGPVYANASDGEDWEEVNNARYHLLRDQLKVYKGDQISWSIWLYKDIGFQGMVYAGPTTAYMERFKQFLNKKKRLAADKWGADVRTVAHVFDPLSKWLQDEIPSLRDRYPPHWSIVQYSSRLIRNILLSEELYPEYAENFRDLSYEVLDQLAASFKFENCVQREGLNAVLRDDAISTDAL
ncbi:endo-1,4-beta-glucanase [Clavulina sp. PMI_390]|nr:endo-1,4-beta-glucanase [Clavulina sp. PMI_390]